MSNSSSGADTAPQWRLALRSRKRFLINAGMALAAFLAVASPTVERYSIAVDSSDIRCIEDYSVFIVDEFNQTLVRGEIYAFHADGLEPFFADGQPLAKYLVGLPGDTVEITADQQIIINGEAIATTLQAAHRLEMAPEDFVGSATLGSDEYWFMGDTLESFDSRYWGSVSRQQIVGRAHGVF